MTRDDALHMLAEMLGGGNPQVEGGAATDSLAGYAGADRFSYVAPVTGEWAPSPQNYFHAARGGLGREHSGNDIRAPKGSPAVAMIGGKVIYTGRDQGYAWNAVVLGDDGNAYRYATHGPLAVKLGETVKQGDKIGSIAGSTPGGAPHLHFEVIPPTIDGKPNKAYEAMVSHPGQFVSTQFWPSRKQPAVTINPAAYFGVSYGDNVVAGGTFGDPSKAAVVKANPMEVADPFGVGAKRAADEAATGAPPLAFADEAGAAASPPPPAAAALGKGQTSPAILGMQMKLADAGLYHGHLDGQFGKQTDKALRAYQKSHPGLKVDGVAGPHTLASLGLADQWYANLSPPPGDTATPPMSPTEYAMGGQSGASDIVAKVLASAGGSPPGPDQGGRVDVPPAPIPSMPPGEAQAGGGVPGASALLNMVVPSLSGSATAGAPGGPGASAEGSMALLPPNPRPAQLVDQVLGGSPEMAAPPPAEPAPTGTDDAFASHAKVPVMPGMRPIKPGPWGADAALKGYANNDPAAVRGAPDVIRKNAKGDWWNIATTYGLSPEAGVTKKIEDYFDKSVADDPVLAQKIRENIASNRELTAGLSPKDFAKVNASLAKVPPPTPTGEIPLPAARPDQPDAAPSVDKLIADARASAGAPQTSGGVSANITPPKSAPAADTERDWQMLNPVVRKAIGLGPQPPPAPAAASPPPGADTERDWEMLNPAMQKIFNEQYGTPPPGSSAPVASEHSPLTGDQSISSAWDAIKNIPDAYASAGSDAAGAVGNAATDLLHKTTGFLADQIDTGAPPPVDRTAMRDFLAQAAAKEGRVASDARGVTPILEAQRITHPDLGVPATVYKLESGHTLMTYTDPNTGKVTTVPAEATMPMPAPLATETPPAASTPVGAIPSPAPQSSIDSRSRIASADNGWGGYRKTADASGPIPAAAYDAVGEAFAPAEWTTPTATGASAPPDIGAVMENAKAKPEPGANFLPYHAVSEPPPIGTYYPPTAAVPGAVIAPSAPAAPVAQVAKTSPANNAKVQRAGGGGLLGGLISMLTGGGAGMGGGGGGGQPPTSDSSYWTQPNFTSGSGGSIYPYHSNGDGTGTYVVGDQKFTY